MQNKEKITIADVARVAKVSAMTVSRVINGNRAMVKASTYARVENAIAELKFVPNASARALAGKRTRRVGVIYHSHSPFSFYLDSLIVNTADALNGVGMQITIVKLNYAASTSEKIAQLDQIMFDLDGIIVPPPLADLPEVRAYLFGLDKPYVLLSGKPSTDSGIRVHIDNDAAAQQLTEHLISLGHSRIAFITGADQHDSLEREKGYRRALQGAGYTVDEELIHSGDFSYESGLFAAERLLADESPPTAVFAANDEMALATVHVAINQNMSVPSDLSVVGFDGSPLTVCIVPRLTSISQQLNLLAENAVRAISDKLAGSAKGGAEQITDNSIVVPYKFLLGASTSKVPLQS